MKFRKPYKRYSKKRRDKKSPSYSNMHVKTKETILDRELKEIKKELIIS